MDYPKTQPDDLSKAIVIPVVKCQLWNAALKFSAILTSLCFVNNIPSIY